MKFVKLIFAAIATLGATLAFNEEIEKLENNALVSDVDDMNADLMSREEEDKPRRKPKTHPRHKNQKVVKHVREEEDEEKRKKKAAKKAVKKAAKKHAAHKH